MENVSRNRAKEHFPAVLLTLLSIVQAIALELLWGHLVESRFLYEFTLGSFIAWAQVLATLLTVALIWIVYASNVMRFRWVPAVTDSLYPFLIGILEFWLVESLHPDSAGQWFFVIGLVFGAMTWVAQATMRSARLDSDNIQFFETVSPATLKDFTPQIIAFMLFVVVGVLTIVFRPPVLLQGVAVLSTLSFLGWQFRSTSRFWSAAMSNVD